MNKHLQTHTLSQVSLQLEINKFNKHLQTHTLTQVSLQLEINKFNKHLQTHTLTHVFLQLKVDQICSRLHAHTLTHVCFQLEVDKKLTYTHTHALVYCLTAKLTAVKKKKKRFPFMSFPVREFLVHYSLSSAVAAGPATLRIGLVKWDPTPAPGDTSGYRTRVLRSTE